MEINKDGTPYPFALGPIDNGYKLNLGPQKSNADMNIGVPNKLTAVEWLEKIVDNMILNGGNEDLLAVIEHIQQAKQMEKEQLLMAYNTGVNISKEFIEEEKENIKVKYNK